MINKHNFWKMVSGVFTFLSIGKIIFEKIVGYFDKNYAENILTIFIVTVIATFLLSLHKYFQSVSILLIMIVQYVLFIGSVMGAAWLEDYFVGIHPNGYRDMFWSTTIPYIVLSGIYYMSFFRQVKKANTILMEINQKQME